MIAPVVVIGAGHGGFHLALAYRELGGRAPVVLLDSRGGLPVQRPPLSKAFLAAPADRAPRLEFRPSEFYEKREIRLRRGRATAIDLVRRTVAIAGDDPQEYGHLVLATGARNRVPEIPGITLSGVVGLRTPEDATGLRDALMRAGDVVVIGGGFIGLEVAAAAAKHGGRVTVIEALDRVMSRVVSAPISRHFEAVHAGHGVVIRTGIGVTALHGEGRVREVELSDGSLLPADLVVVGVGVLPEVDLARDSGLAVDNGIAVDDTLLTSDASVSAIGDCASFPVGEDRRRLESVQNAADHARTVAARLTGDPRRYEAVPWFWSEQHGSKLQIVGVPTGGEDDVVRADGEGGFSVLHFAGGALTVVESVDRPADHAAARRLLGSSSRISPEHARAHGFRLADLVGA